MLCIIIINQTTILKPSMWVMEMCGSNFQLDNRKDYATDKPSALWCLAQKHCVFLFGNWQPQSKKFIEDLILSQCCCLRPGHQQPKLCQKAPGTTNRDWLIVRCSQKDSFGLRCRDHERFWIFFLCCVLCFLFCWFQNNIWNIRVCFSGNIPTNNFYDALLLLYLVTHKKFGPVILESALGARYVECRGEICENTNQSKT